MIIANTPDQIQMFRLLTIRSGLKLEIKTGMRHSRNMIFNAAKQVTGKKTRQACLDALNKIIEEKRQQQTPK